MFYNWIKPYFIFCSCFLSQIGALFGAFLVPIFVVIIINAVIFIWVIVVVRRHTQKKTTQMKQIIPTKQILRIACSISGVLFLFGLTWGFFILTFSVSGLRETFQIPFTVFNSLQGFFVFAFILFTEGFGHWKAILSCEKYRSNSVNYPSALTKNQQTMDLSNLSKQTNCSSVLTTDIDADKLTVKEKEAFYYRGVLKELASILLKYRS